MTDDDPAADGWPWFLLLLILAAGLVVVLLRYSVPDYGAIPSNQ